MHFLRVCLLVCLAMALSVAVWAAPVRTDQFVGSDVCLMCHEKQAKTIAQNPHWKKAIKGAPINAQGCESCHGPGAVHAEKGGGKGVGGLITFARGESAEVRSGVCLTCHENQPGRAMWASGVHRKKDVSCSDCHTTHGYARTAKGYGTTLTGLGYSPTWEYQTCGKCHLDIKAQVNRRSHHPIIEGRVTCSSCHQPHGTMDQYMIRAASTNQLCYKCHAEKRGPFMWEHPPVEENCMSCHKPHGSVHLRLTSEKVPNLCQGCHDATRHPGTRYSRETTFRGPTATQSSRSFGRACLNCHINVHGSNAPANPATLQNSGTYFLR
jgi:DmsE family decaheme c-type cytochrome